MTVTTILKLITATFVSLVVGVTLWYAYYVYYGGENPYEEQETLLASLEKGELVDLEMGDRAFARAMSLISEGEHEKAGQKLLLIMSNYPQSNAAQEARRIVGQMNLDQLFSESNQTGKIRYTVKPGDQYFAIAQKHETTIASLVLLNQLDRLDRLRPKDQLVLLPLHFELLVDTTEQRVEVKKEGRFIVSYPIVESVISEDLRGLWVAEVSRLVSVFEGRSYRAHHEHYLKGHKEVYFNKGQFKLLPKMELEEKQKRAFYLHPHHLEELCVLLREGTHTEIRFPKR